MALTLSASSRLAVLLLSASTVVSGQQPRRPMQGAPPRDARAAQPAPAGTGTISGTIVVSGSGQPGRKVRVSLSGPELRGNRSTLTDDQGRFLFTALPVGRFTLSASKPGHVAVTYGQRSPGTPGTPIQLGEGQKLAVQLQIFRGSVVTGTVLDEQGEATPGTQVRAFRHAVQNGRRTLQVAGSASTDDRGIYRIFGLQPGTYAVCATPRNQGRVLLDGLPLQAADVLEQRLAQVQGRQNQAPEEPSTGYAPVCYPGTTAVSQAGAVALGVGEERPGVDFQLQLVPLGRIDGLVINATGEPLQNVQITLRQPGALTPLLPTASARADAEGRFRLTSVAPGQYTLQARMQAGGGRGMGALLGALGAGRGGRGGAAAAQQPERAVLWASADINVDGRNLSNVVLTLQPAMTLSGQIVFEGSTPPPADLTRVRVSASPVEGSAGGGSTARVEPNGRFTLPNLVPGEYRVNVAGAPGWFAESAVVGGQDALDFPFEVKPSQGIAAAVITMTDRQTELRGSVTDGGQPAPDYTLVIFPADQRFWTSPSRRVQMTRPATDGTYVFRNLPAGEYRVAPVLDVPAGGLADPAFLQQLESAALRVTLQPGEKKMQDVRIANR